jgi:hypothetical protein
VLDAGYRTSRHLAVSRPTMQESPRHHRTTHSGTPVVAQGTGAPPQRRKCRARPRRRNAHATAAPPSRAFSPSPVQHLTLRHPICTGDPSSATLIVRPPSPVAFRVRPSAPSTRIRHSGLCHPPQGAIIQVKYENSKNTIITIK